MACKSEFTLYQEKKLVELVERHICIYDVASYLYKDQNLKDNAWKDISKRVGRSADQCKWRWRNIKDTYVKRKRKVKNGSESSLQKKWHLANMLKFLDDIQFKKRSNNNTNNDHPMEFINILQLNEQNNDSAPSCSEVSPRNISSEPVVNRRNTRNCHKLNKTQEVVLEKKLEIKTEKPERPEKLEKVDKTLDRIEITDMLGYQEDHIDVFFRSVALSVKGFPKPLINQAKLRTLQMLVELEGKCSSNQ